jgi:cell division septation protein DedD
MMNQLSATSFRPLLLAVLAVALAAPPVQAQGSGTPYQRAERLVREGRGTEGRAIVDSVLRSLPEDSPELSEALYWRATLASDAADAERDYRRIIVEHPSSSRSEDALINLAQLELARGDRSRAIATLERFEREHPSSASRARVTLWRARALFDARDEAGACAAIASARSRVGENDVELRNQIDFLAPRCQGVDTTRAVAAAPREVPTVMPSAAPEQRPTRSDVTVPRQPEASPARSEATVPRQPPADRPPATAPARARFAVQVAAYSAREDADKLVERLAGRGYQARVVGTAKPFRVWIGRYATRAEADAAQQRMRSANVIGFVTEAEDATR